jgi:formamidopyrimidine-DNA glycosylase
MSGSYKVLKKSEAEDYIILQHDHLIIDLDNYKIVYNDPRRFGYIDLTNQEPETHKFLSSLGPEPLSNYFNADNLAETLLNKKKSIKNSLLDQSIISGLGNIYVCEALFRSKINPKKNCSKLVTSKGKPKKNLILLVQKINEVIKEAIEVGGSTLRDFSNISGKMGYFQSSFNVYNRENEKCLLDDCDGVIKRIIQSGRSTFFCSKCQK